MEKLEHKLIIMREMHEEHQIRHSLNNNNSTITYERNGDAATQNNVINNNVTNSTDKNINNNRNINNTTNNINSGDVYNEFEPDPFYDSQENHNLIGVANIFLECLFNDVKLSYFVPIISQQAEVAGRLQVCVLANLKRLIHIQRVVYLSKWLFFEQCLANKIFTIAIK